MVDLDAETVYITTASAAVQHPPEDRQNTPFEMSRTILTSGSFQNHITSSQDKIITSGVTHKPNCLILLGSYAVSP